MLTSIYNAVKEVRTRLRPRAGAGTRIEQALGGWTLSAGRAEKWRHPWHVTPFWSPEGNHWAVTVKPGFVNQECPIWRTVLKAEQQDGQQDFGINPLTGKPFFSSFVFNQDSPAAAAASAVVDIPLFFSPAIPMSWRALGWDSAGTESVPGYFLNRGVVASPFADVTSLADATPGQISDQFSAPEGLRLLRVCDMWVHQPRAALTSSVTVLPGFATGEFTLLQVLGEKPAMPGDALQIMVGEYDELQVPSIDQVQNEYEEFPWDQILLARVYVMSPPNTAPGSEPDGTWTAFVEHHLFWNLMYRATPFVPPVPEPNVPFIVTLAGGAAQPIINYLTSSLNDGLLRVFNVTRGHSLAGVFWTLTGGGSTISLAPSADDQAAAGQQGLNKTERIAAAARARRAKAYTGTLDPAFPYRAVAFDYTRFFSN